MPKIFTSRNTPLAVYLVPILAQHDVLRAAAEGELVANGVASAAGLCHCKARCPVRSHFPYLTFHQIKRLLFGAIRDHVLRRISPHHAVEQRLKIIHMLVDHVAFMTLRYRPLSLSVICLKKSALHRSRLDLSRINDSTSCRACAKSMASNRSHSIRLISGRSQGALGEMRSD